VLPPLPAPRLPERALEYLRTPPTGDQNEEARYVTASWGSPYPQAHSSHLRRQSFSSEPSEDSPIHQLEIATPFLRPRPELSNTQADNQHASLVSAAVLANRARRPARGITEDWIWQHTAGDLESERKLWLSDGTGDSEHSSLSGSVSGEEAGWLKERDPETPRATADQIRESRRVTRRHTRRRTSVETLKQIDIAQQVGPHFASMDSPEMEKVSHDGSSDRSLAISTHEEPQAMEAPSTPRRSTETQNGSANKPLPVTPIRATPSRMSLKQAASTPPLKKKIPWKGKNILVLLPRDDQRGKPGEAPTPLNGEETSRMLRDWEELGYSVRGFDLQPDAHSHRYDIEDHSQSREGWPDFDDVAKERAERRFKVTLPDLNGKISIPMVPLYQSANLL
jgi:hypothetical protein